MQIVDFLKLFNSEKSADWRNKDRLLRQQNECRIRTQPALNPNIVYFLTESMILPKSCPPLLCIIRQFQYPTWNRPYLRAYLPTLPVNWYITTLGTWISSNLQKDILMKIILNN